AFHEWRRLRCTAWRKANGLPAKHYGHSVCFRAWQQRTRRLRDLRMWLPKEVRGPAERHHGHGLALCAWRRRVRHQRNVRGVLLKEVATSEDGLRRLVLAAWSVRLRHRQGRRRGVSAADRIAVKLLAHQGRALKAVVLHGWWLSNLVRRHGGRDRFHLGLQKLQRWRAYSERAATGTALSAALTLGAGEALGETQRKHFLSARAFQEWCRALTESRESALFHRKIDMRKALLQRVATIWAQDEASTLLRTSFDLWHSTQIFLAVAPAIRSLCAAPHCPGVHTWHTVTAMRGIWKAELSGINEGSAAEFYSHNCSSLSTFEIEPAANTSFGFEFGPGADFDIAYTLTVVRSSAEPLNLLSPSSQDQHSGRLMEKSASKKDCEDDTDGCLLQLAASSVTTFTSMACVFVITAKGPAQPDVRVETFNGAICRWQVNPGYGENYEVDFKPN
ncbi:ANKRD17, partial [Symbiodinium sp. CCMP2456]